MSTISKNNLYNIYKELDLYRAKYRHSDFTPYAWCFHGGKQQGWVSSYSHYYSTPNNYRLKVSGDTRKVVNISNPSTYKYLSFGIDVPIFWNKKEGSRYVEYERPSDWTVMLELSYKADGVWHKISTNLPERSNIAFFDMSSVSQWVNASVVSELIIAPRLAHNRVPVTDESQLGIFRIEYVKIDRLNVLREAVDNDATIVVDDVNALKTMLDSVVSVVSRTNKMETVKSFVQTIRAKNFNAAVDTVRSLPPYNGCATCDTYTCSCNSTSYGYRGCSTCNGCNSYRGCSCDRACYSQPISCSCQSCNAQGKASCTCNGVCYSYKACSCNGRCYSQGRSCTCNKARYGYKCTCQEPYSCGTANNWRG